jgi:aminobenzoyl-glutamate utilization protein B
MSLIKRTRKKLSPEDRDAALIGMDKQTAAQLKEKHIADLIPPFSKKEIMLSGSTDVGDVSWIVPTTQCMTVCWRLGLLSILGRSYCL